MNRTERLHAVSEELRRVGRRGTTSRRLAARFEVSERTIKRDVLALQQAGLTVWAQAGPGGGYVLDGSATLPPINFSPAQAVAVSIALAALPPGSPFAVDARSARAKLWDALGEPDRNRAERLADRVWVLPDRTGRDGPDGTVRTGVLRAVEQALAGSRVLAIRYRGRAGEETNRRVEPVILAYNTAWHLVAWCRLREGIRWFRLDRIERADLTADGYAPRPVADIGVPPAGAAAVRGRADVP